MGGCVGRRVVGGWCGQCWWEMIEKEGKRERGILMGGNEGGGGGAGGGRGLEGAEGGIEGRRRYEFVPFSPSELLRQAFRASAWL